MRKTEEKDLTDGVVWKRLLIFFLPIAAGTCIQQLYNAVDGMIVGRYVGTEALAAVGGSSAQIINLLIGFFTAVTAGAAVVIAQIYGAGQKDNVQKAAGNAIAVFSLMGIGLAVFGITASPWMLRILRTPADTIAGAVTYLRIYFAGVPFVLILNMESNLLRAVGDSYDPFVYMVVGCIANIILDFAFVLWLGMGIAGVAIATVIAQIVNMGLLTWKLMTTKESYRLTVSTLSLNGRYLINMMRIGIPGGMQAAMYSVSNMIIQVGVNTLGTVVVASWAMASKTDGIYWAVSNALGAAITTFIGQNFGAGKTERVKECVRQGMILSMAVTVSISTLIMLAAKPLLSVLTTDGAVIGTTYKIMTYFVPYYFTWTLIEVLSAVLRGVGDAVKPVVIIGLGICGFRILWMSTVFVKYGTLRVLSLNYVVSWVITSLALLIYYKRGHWLESAEKRLSHN